ncbi:hypothetical protein M5689_024477 [Euphorbia peplus]|nr:hypothetical protein M5689_024477 [Euphorbia peplus]
MSATFMPKMLQLSSTTFKLRCYQPNKTMFMRRYAVPKRPGTSRGKPPQINYLEPKSMTTKQKITLSGFNDEKETNLSKQKPDVSNMETESSK